MSFPVPGLIHEYAPRKIAFEFNPTSNTNVLVFIGGLMDGILTVPYLQLLAEKLSKIGYTLIQIQISSSHIGWGTGSLTRDSKEISELISYLRSEKGGKRSIVGLMGHSTGCQNTTHYFNVHKRDANYSPADFGILQAPVSDRTAAQSNMSEEEITESLELAQELIKNHRHKELMPPKFLKKFFDVPINAYRWNSLIAVRGDDDFFSPDLDESDWSKTFGKFDKPYLILYSGSDEYVPAWLDKHELLSKWKKYSNENWSEYSKVVDGALHNIGPGSKEGAQEDAIETVIKFINDL